MSVWSRLRVAASAGALAALIAGPGHAQDRGRFDGTWQVVLTCTGARDGADGYTFRFPASVRAGVLRGENGVRGEPSYLTLDGQIQPDGTALLFAQGLTGQPNYSVGRVSAGTRYSYHMKARFDAAHGTGTRIELRPCDAVFTKQ